MKTCPDCNGDGVIEKGTDDEHQCPTCGGSGFVPDDNDDNEEIIRTVDAKEMSAKGQWRTHCDLAKHHCSITPSSTREHGQCPDLSV